MPNPGYSRLHTCLEAIRIAVCSCPLLHVCMCAYNQISTTIWDLEEVERLEVVRLEVVRLEVVRLEVICKYFC